MKYAVIEVCGRQIIIEEGRFYTIHRLPCKIGTSILFARILFCNDKGLRFIGYPYLKEKDSRRIQITGTVLEHFRGSKIVIFKMLSKKKFRRTNGHRQSHTRIVIDKIKVN